MESPTKLTSGKIRGIGFGCGTRTLGATMAVGVGGGDARRGWFGVLTYSNSVGCTISGLNLNSQKHNFIFKINVLQSKSIKP